MQNEGEALSVKSEILSVNHLPSLLWPLLSRWPSACTDALLLLVSKEMCSVRGHSAFMRLEMLRQRKIDSLWIVLPSPCCSEA